MGVGYLSALIELARDSSTFTIIWFAPRHMENLVYSRHITDASHRHVAVAVVHVGGHDG